MDLTKLLLRLSEACCVRREHPAAQLVADTLKRLGFSPKTDPSGNLTASFGSSDERAPRLMLEAHLDEIAFLVTRVTDEGFLRVAQVGGPDLRVIAAHEVTVLGKEPLFGVFCSQPPHLTDDAARQKALSLDDALVDIGFSKAETEKRVSPGDFVFLRRRPVELTPGLVCGKALDNRAGCAAVLRMLELLRDKPLRCRVTALFALGEELGERGAQTGTYFAAPDRAVIVDTSFARSPHDPADKTGRMGGGPMVGFAPTLDFAMTRELCAAADAAGVRWQREIMAGETGTDADVAASTRGGVRTALLSVPLNHMHTANEIVAVADVEATAQMAVSWAARQSGALPDSPGAKEAGPLV